MYTIHSKLDGIWLTVNGHSEVITPDTAITLATDLLVAARSVSASIVNTSRLNAPR